MQPDLQPERAPESIGPFEAALVELICTADAASLERDLPAIFAAHGVVDAARALEADPRAPARLLAYRTLVHARFRGVAEVTMPRTAARLGPERLAAEVAHFVEEHASPSPYVRDVATELCAWWTRRWPGDASVPGYLLDLARHELLAVDVGAAEDDAPPDAGPGAVLSAWSALRLQRGARLVRYAFAVHRLPEDDVSAVPERIDTALLAYRDREHWVRYLELSTLGAAVVERLRAGASLEVAVREGCGEAGASLDGATLAGIVALLEDLERRGIVLGQDAGSTTGQ
ncbi:MAG: putative DNA-binding domain-containing protein [Myxococcales bacterium]|nr:putative DNA-binding domain-containing protein [Myxococcales bacterium]